MPEKKSPEQERARRLQDVIDKGPRPARSPHEFIQEKMREERRKEKAPSPDRPSKSKKAGQ